MKLENKAILILIFVTAMWGLTFPLIHNAMQDIGPFAFVFVRMVLATIGFLPFVFKRFRNTNSLLFWGGLLLAILNTVTYLFQSEGLETISASRSAFITGTNVILVPLLAPLFRFGRPKIYEVIAALFCMLGLYILTGESVSHISVGDIWTFGCALLYALTILTLQIISKRCKDNTLLGFYLTAFGMLVPAAFLYHSDFQHVFSPAVIIALLFCAFIATALVNYLMTHYQQHVSVTKVAVIYALEPVFATVFSVLIEHEHLNYQIYVGGGVIFFSILLPDLIRLARKN
tara:strand:+ start:43697 stop:44560 length:864 start_codon:yes stop_codon:yes gene_type:complete